MQLLYSGDEESTVRSPALEEEEEEEERKEEEEEGEEQNEGVQSLLSRGETWVV